MFVRLNYHTIFCVIGFLLSAYAYYVKKKKAEDSNYQAMCDISQHMQCSKVLTSQWSKGFGIAGNYLPQDHFLNISNAIVGLTFYAAQIILKWTFAHKVNLIVFVSNLLASISSIYLAYILAFHLKDFCLVCVSTYFVNFSLLYISYHEWIYT